MPILLLRLHHGKWSKPHFLFIAAKTKDVAMGFERLVQESDEVGGQGCWRKTLFGGVTICRSGSVQSANSLPPYRYQ